MQEHSGTAQGTAVRSHTGSGTVCVPYSQWLHNTWCGVHLSTLLRTCFHRQNFSCHNLRKASHLQLILINSHTARIEFSPVKKAKFRHSEVHEKSSRHVKQLETWLMTTQKEGLLKPTRSYYRCLILIDKNVKYHCNCVNFIKNCKTKHILSLKMT